MKNSELIKILQQYPQDAEVTFSVSGNYYLELESVEDIADLTDGEHNEVEVCLTDGDKESFEITAVSREDLSALGFYSRDILDSTMKRIASKMGDAYCENGFWTDLEIIAEEGFDIYKFQEGDIVKWHDPAINDYDEEEREDALNREFKIISLENDGEALISDGFTEAEVYLSELELIRSVDEEEE